MNMKKYEIKDLVGEKSVVWEIKRQKDILDILDEMLENAKTFGWHYIFEDDSFFIEYKDGKTYGVNEYGAEGKYKKKGIKRIIYVNSNDTQVYGKYEVDDYGIVI